MLSNRYRSQITIENIVHPFLAQANKLCLKRVSYFTDCEGNVMNKRLLHTIYITFGLLILAGCHDPVIDASSEATIQNSIKKVFKQLPVAKHDEFEAAFNIVTIEQIDMDDFLLAQETGFKETDEKIRAAIHGKTGLEIIEEANRILAQQKQVSQE